MKTLAVDATFVAQTAQRSLPSRKRPRLNTDIEDRLADVDRRDAVKYASMETLTHQFNSLAEAIDADGVPEERDDFNDDSLIHHIEVTRAKLIG
jgi:hypothetical protein